MAKKPPNLGKEWSRADVSKLKDLARGNTPTPLIAYKLERTEAGVRAKAHEKGVSLKPTNKSPYTRRKA
ncbi:MAG: hypothetical protein NT005_02980 [Spirochaetes bacterium]|nr:hypothetical protein [Spirochaetota bacterium]